MRIVNYLVTLHYTLLLAGVAWLGTACSSGPASTAGGDNAAVGNKEMTAAAPTAGSKGIGPVTDLALDAVINPEQVAQGQLVYESKCTACHQLDSPYLGPALAGVTQRRRPEWIMNMILNPQEMTQQDETARALYADYMTQMPNLNLAPAEARSVLEFLRTKTKK